MKLINFKLKLNKMKEKNFQDTKQKSLYPNKIIKNENISKDLKKEELNNNKIIHKNTQKLRQNNILQNANRDKKHIRAKSKSDPNQKSTHLCKDISKEKINNKNHSNISKQDNKYKKDIKTNLNMKSISNEKEKKFKEDSNISKIFKTNESTIKINLKKISKKAIDNPTKLNTNANYENLKYIPLDDISSLFNAWQNSFIIYKEFEDKLLNKNNFEINKNTLEIISKNTGACKQLNDQIFWILYIEYLINNNLLLNENQFITLINEAFSYMEGHPFSLLKNYYIRKIKNYSPASPSNETSDENDEIYINKLDKSVINLIKSQKQQKGLYSLTVLKNRRISLSEQKEKEEVNNKIVQNLYNIFNEVFIDSNNK